MSLLARPAALVIMGCQPPVIFTLTELTVTRIFFSWMENGPLLKLVPLGRHNIATEEPLA